MGSYNFIWPHPARKVFVTGTFDKWGKSVELKKEGPVFSKIVELPLSDQDIHYTFVVDGNWMNDHTAPTEKDEDGYINNVLKPSDVNRGQQSDQNSQSILGSVGAMISSMSPNSSTAHEAGQAPLEKLRNVDQRAGELPLEDMPGTFPDETAFHETQEYPMHPASSGSGNPGQLARGHAGTDNDNYHSKFTSQNPRDEYSLTQDPKEYEKSFGVAPLPATAGIGNPIQLQPGEKVPSSNTFTSNTIQNNVKTDRTSYEKSDAYPGDAAQDKRDSAPDARGTAFGMPPIMSGMIPQSNLPMGRDQGPFMQSAGPGTSTAALAGQVLVEPRGVPQIVRESQRAAHFPPEASASSDAVMEKREIEQELRSKIPIEQPITRNSDRLASNEAPVPEVVIKSQHKAHASPEASASLVAVQEKTAVEQELLSKMPVRQPVAETSQSASASPPIPEVVLKSQHKAHASPEASASPVAVQEKTAVEQELLSKMPVRQPVVDSTRLASASPPIPAVVIKSQERAHAPPEASASPEAVQEKSAVEQELLSKMPVRQPVAESSRFAGDSPPIPEIVRKSQHNAHSSPEASASPVAVQEKSAVEQELLSRVRTEQPRSATSAAPGDIAPGVPVVVGESQQAAQASPEASASENAVMEKSAFEQELKSKVPEEHATSESSTHRTGILAAAVTGGAALIGGVAAVATGVPAALTKTIADINAGIHHHSASNSTAPERVPESQELTDHMPGALPDSEAVTRETATERESMSKVAPAQVTESNMSRNTFATSGNAPRLDSSITANTVPERVRESLQAAHRSPEAAANPEAVMEKKDVERELMREIKPAQATGANFLGSTSSSTGRDSMPDYSTTAKTVPERVRESLQAAHESPEAAANPEAVSEKRAVEKELMREITPAQSSAEVARTTVVSSSPIAPSRSTAMPSSGALSGAMSSAPTSTMAGSRLSGNMIYDEPVLAPMSTSRMAGNVNPNRYGPAGMTGSSPISEDVEHQRTMGGMPSTIAGSENSGFPDVDDNTAAPAIAYVNRDVEPEREAAMRSDHSSTSAGIPSTFGGMLPNFGGSSPRSGGWTDTTGPMSSSSGESSPVLGGVSKTTMALAAGMTGVSVVGAGVIGDHFSHGSTSAKLQPDSSASLADRSFSSSTSAGQPASSAYTTVDDGSRYMASSASQPVSSTPLAFVDRLRDIPSSADQPASIAPAAMADRFRDTSSSDGYPVSSASASVADRSREIPSSASQITTNAIPMATAMTGVSVIGAGALGEHFSHGSPSQIAQSASSASAFASNTDHSRDNLFSAGQLTSSAPKIPMNGGPASNVFQTGSGMTGVNAIGAGAGVEHSSQSTPSATPLLTPYASSAVAGRLRDIPATINQPLSSAASQSIASSAIQPLSSATSQTRSSAAIQPLTTASKTSMTGAAISDSFHNSSIQAPAYNPTTSPTSKPVAAMDSFKNEPLSVSQDKSSFAPKAIESLPTGGVGAGVVTATTTAGKSSTPLSTYNNAAKAATVAAAQPGPGLYIPPSSATKPAATEAGSLRASAAIADTKSGPGFNTPTSTPAKSAATESSLLSALPAKTRSESRDISPFSKPGAAGAGSSGNVPEKSTPTRSSAGMAAGGGGAAGVGSSSSAGGSPSSYKSGPGESSKDEKRRKRTSFFGKIKDKLHRDK